MEAVVRHKDFRAKRDLVWCFHPRREQKVNVGELVQGDQAAELECFLTYSMPPSVYAVVV